MGDNSIIGATVVTKNASENKVFCGSEGRVVKYVSKRGIRSE